MVNTPKPLDSTLHTYTDLHQLQPKLRSPLSAPSSSTSPKHRQWRKSSWHKLQPPVFSAEGQNFGTILRLITAKTVQKSRPRITLKLRSPVVASDVSPAAAVFSAAAAAAASGAGVPAIPSRQRPEGSIGPLIGVLTVIIVLGVIACLIGRLCSGRRIAGIGQYDVEGWMERNFASCINGPPAVLPPLSSSVTEGAAVDGAGSPRIEAAQP
ncbi:hypothetical protein HPP92_025047 [Vanilla planifolia]|uniref:Uncharacterized protein n=1 Tax=Vanilla planifolia TaxID=51239 RepID=A0A835UA20_VANPL|nr:hypothetical protein HPP92_025047 [Vanilla planifolia]